MSQAASLPGAELLPEIVFFGRSHLSWAASLPGAELFPENLLFLKKPLVPGSFAAWGRTVSRKLFFEKTTCPGQLRRLGQNCFSRKSILFLKKSLVRGSFTAWGRVFSRKSTFFLKKPLVPGSFAAWGRTFLQKTDFQEFWGQSWGQR